MKIILLIISFLLLTFSINPQVADEYLYPSIADGDTLSESFSRIDRLCSVIPITGMEGTKMRFYSSSYEDSTFYPLEYNGAIYEVELTVNSDIALEPVKIYALKKFVKIWVDVAQTGANYFKVGYGTY